MIILFLSDKILTKKKFLKTKIKILALAFGFMISCDQSDPEPVQSIEANRYTNLEIITSGNEKTWKAKVAVLSNAFIKIDPLNISSTQSVQDDEFIFNQKGENLILKWKKRRDINFDATSILDSNSDFHSSIEEMVFEFLEDSDNKLIEINQSSTIELNADNSISFHLDMPSGNFVDWVLEEKTTDDYLKIPQGILEFEMIFPFESSGINTGSPSIIGSYRSNKIYMASRNREDNNSPFFESLWVYDFENNFISQVKTVISDYTSKQIQFQGDKLLVFGGHFVNEYQLESMNLVESIDHGRNLSRSGITEIDGEIYLIGGEYEYVEQGKVYKWDPVQKEISDFANLPIPKVGARGTIVDGYLYVFGGNSPFQDVEYSNDIYKINLNSPEEIESFNLPEEVQYTYVDRIENLIYVAGSRRVNENGAFIKEYFIGVYNTIDDSFQEISTNLTQSYQNNSIEGMCIFNGKIYVVMKNLYNENFWDVLAADLP